MRSILSSLKGKGGKPGEEEEGNTQFHSRPRRSLYPEGEPRPSQMIEENEDQPTTKEPVIPSQKHSRDPNSDARRQQFDLTQDRHHRRQAIDGTLARWARRMKSTNIRRPELSIPSRIYNWEKIPYEFRCRDTGTTKLGVDPNRLFWFAETDTIYVPPSRGGPADIPISREGMRYIIPSQEDQLPFPSLGKFWETRRKALEELKMTGRLTNRDTDRWGRPWSEHHAGLGKEPRKQKHGKQDDITIFDLGCGGERRITKPWWEYKISMFVADAFMMIRD